MTGTIAKVISDKGFGLIQGEDGHEYFMHRSAVGTARAIPVASVTARVRRAKPEERARPAARKRAFVIDRRQQFRR